MALAIAAGLLGCGTSGDAGVHAYVTIDAKSLDPADLFNHVTVTATGGGKRGVACIFPIYAVDRVIGIDSPKTCADADTGAGWVEPPTIDQWALDETHDAVNFTFADGDDVSIVASAAFGGGAELARAAGESVADASYPTIALELERDPNAPKLEACAAKPVLEGEMFLNAEVPDLCHASPVDCPATAPGEAVNDKAMSCIGTSANRVRNGPGLVGCTDADVVWRGAPQTSAASKGVAVLVAGHFVRCASGDPSTCTTLTTACTPPSTSIVLFGNGVRVAKADLSCLPAYAVPMTFEVDLATMPATPWTIAIAQDPIAAMADDACFFDVYSVAAVPLP